MVDLTMADGAQVERVELQMDSRGYQQEATKAAAATAALSASIDALSQRLDGLFKRTGTRMQAVGAGITAGLAGAATVAARYEQQQSPIRASQRIAGEDFARVQQDIDELSRTLPLTRSEVSALALEITNLGERSPDRIRNITDEMTRLSAVTGEAVPALTRQTLEFQRTMGNIQDMEAFASSLSQVTREMGVTAQGTLQFAQAIAPFTRQVGIGTEETIGIAAAFQRAGEDGYRSASAFNKMLSDITRNIQSGSPELARYSNLIGVTREQFAEMDQAEAITRVFSAIGEQGADGIRTLDKLGLDGVRTAKAIQAVANEAGGLEKAIAQAGIGARNSDLFNDASSEAMDGLNDEIGRTRDLLEEGAKTVGDELVGGFEMAATALNGVLAAANDLVAVLSKPLAAGGVLAAVGGLVGGAGLRAYSTMAAGGAALYAARSTPVQGALRAFREGQGYAATGMPGPLMDRYAAGEIPGWRGGLVRAAMGAGTFFPQGEPRDYIRGAASGVMRAGTAWYRGMGDFYQQARMAGVDRPRLFGRQTDDTGRRIGLRERAAGVVDWRQRMRADYEQGERGMLARGLRYGSPQVVGEFDKALKENVKATQENVRTNRSLGRDFSNLSRAFVGQGYQAARTTLGTAGRFVGRGAMALAGGPVGLSLMGLTAGAALYGQVRSSADRNSEIEDWVVNPMRMYREEVGLTSTALGSFRDTLEATRRALPTPKDTGEITEGEVRYAQAQAQPFFPGAEGIQTVDQAAAFYAMMQGQPGEVQQQARFDIIRQLEEQGAQEALGRAAGMTPIEGMREMLASATGFTGLRGFAARELPNLFQEMFLPASSAGGLPLVGPLNFSEEERTRLNLATSGLATIRQEELAIGGERAATQAQLPALLGLLEEAAQAGSQSQFDAIIANLVKQDVLEPGVRGTDFMRKYLLTGGDVETSFVEMLARGGEQNQRKLADLEAGGYVFDTEMTPAVQERIERFRMQDIQTARYGNLRGEADRDVRRLFLGSLGRQDVDTRVETSLAKVGDTAAAFEAMQQLSRQSLQLGGSFSEADDVLQRLQGAIGDVTDDFYQLASGARTLLKAQYEQQVLPTLGREQRVGYRADVLEQQLNVPERLRGPEWADDTRAAEEALRGEQEQYRQYLIGLERAFDQYEVQISRMQEDAGIQRSRATQDHLTSMRYMQEDYQKSAARAEADYLVASGRQWDDFYLSQDRALQDFQRSQGRAREDFRRQQDRAQEDFERSQTRAVQDFQRQQLRAQQDFAREMRRSNEDLAASFYDPFKKAGAQYTYGANDLLVNLRRQNELIEQQVADIQRLKEAGLSDAAIQQLDLFNPNQRQQVGRLVEGARQDPSVIANINREVAQRIDLAEGITFDESNSNYQRALQDFRQSQSRAAEDFYTSQQRATEDFAKQTARALEDFGRQIARSVEDFQRASERAAEDARKAAARMEEDYKRASARALEDMQTAMTRAEETFARSIQRMGEDTERATRRAKEDLVRLAKEYTGTVQDLARRTSEWLRNNLPGAGDAVRAEITRTATRLDELQGKWDEYYRNNKSAAEQWLRVQQQNRLQAQIGGSLAGDQRGLLRAGGGLVVGSGTDTSDNVPAWLSPGEYVVRASKVREYGPAFFDRINSGPRLAGRPVGADMPAMAVGGLVSDHLARMSTSIPAVRSGGSAQTLMVDSSMHIQNLTVVSNDTDNVLEQLQAQKRKRQLVRGKGFSL